MSKVGQLEIAAQQRVIEVFKGLAYEYLGDWQDRPENDNVEIKLLSDWLATQGHDTKLIEKVLRELGSAKSLGAGKDLYAANREVYSLLRYGVKVSPGIGEHKETVWLIDWEHPENNHFAIAEEVTVEGHHTKRPDIVLYVNGIAVGVLELKRSIVSVGEGIRQNLDNQKKEFIRSFFSTIQLVMAGNDSEGLRYGVIDTSEKYYLSWKEDSDVDNLLDRVLTQMCAKDRLLEIIHDFIVFDAGVKKTCRHSQYFGVKAAQQRVESRDGGIMWHTQGSGKSLIMVWLAKWLREHQSDARVLIITDRTELDEQIEKVFKGIDEGIYRTKSGADLAAKLNDTAPWLMCSLVHKFGASDDTATDEFLEEFEKVMPAGFEPKGNLFVFVDECHRTQSGKLHEAMKRVLPDAMFIGFTGTPLLKEDKVRSIETFGSYIHTYKFDEAVRDGVILDLRYEARDIDQRLTSPQKIDTWFKAKTSSLSDIARAELKRKWGTMQKVLSSQSRLEKIVADILFDMETRDRLMSGQGNAMLVCSSIYQACKTYELFSKTHLKGKCAIVTSYSPTTSDIKGEESGEGLTERIRKYDIYRRMLADHFDESEDKAVNKVEEFETAVKKQFIDEPGQMKLVIVVDKLLTGFDAPPATYLYIDKHMRDHGLFQAICRVNRLDGDDKEYGYIIDYKDLFNSLEGAIHDYTGGALDGYDSEDVAGLLEDRLGKARERLEDAREVVKAICEPAGPSKDTIAYLHYFCAEDTSDKSALKDNESKRVGLYKAVTSLVRSFANLANEIEEAGYTTSEAKTIKGEVDHYEKVRQEVKLASGDYVDLKMFEPAMRHLLDTYIQADETEVVSSFDDLGLLDLIIEHGPEKATEKLPAGIRKNKDAVAETIENNIRKVIIDELPINPKYFENMSELLDALIKERKSKAIAYKAYLIKLVELTHKVKQPGSSTEYPDEIDTGAKQALYDNLGEDPDLAVRIDTVVRHTKRDGWRGNKVKEREVRNAIRAELDISEQQIADIFELVKNQHEY